MPKRYEIRHMFAHTFEGDAEATFFTRDNQWKLSKLPDKVLKDKIDKGFVVETDLSPASAAAYDAAAVAVSPKAAEAATQEANEPAPAVRRELRKGEK